MVVSTHKMKLFLVITLAIAASSASVIQDPVLGYKEGDRYFYFPGDGDGKLHLVDSQEPVDEEYIKVYSRNPANNAYFLYTRQNPDWQQLLLAGNIRSVQESNFDPRKNTVFISHGWNGHGENQMNRLLTEAFLIDDDVNVIVLDWRRLANRNYVTAKNGCIAVGTGLGEFINWMVEECALDYEKVHLVGFSLGGHLVGAAGRATDGRVKRITALDPAGPLWTWTSGRVRPSDAQYIEVIHTNTNFLGYTDPCGDVDFYPNGGNSMPGCWVSSCSHGRAYEYMASSVKHNHLHGNECATYREASRDRCSGDLHPMGNSDITKNHTGIFRVNTARNYPY